MKLAIMQPYFFPYLGYFQLIHAVDTFVFHDDVAFRKQGWINRRPSRRGPHEARGSGREDSRADAGEGGNNKSCSTWKESGPHRP